MECCCHLADHNDYDANNVYRAKMVKARKPHNCCECRRIIASGEMYERVNLCSEGGWSEFKTCIGCKRLRDDMACGGAFLFEGLDQAVQGCCGFSLYDDPSTIKDED